MGVPLRVTTNGEEEAKAANYPTIRFFNVVGHPAYHRTDDIEGSWKVVSPETANSVSAVAYYFARRVQQDISVPIGLVIDAVGSNECIVLKASVECPIRLHKATCEAR